MTRLNFYAMYHLTEAYLMSALICLLAVFLGAVPVIYTLLGVIVALVYVLPGHSTYYPVEPSAVNSLFARSV